MAESLGSSVLDLYTDDSKLQEGLADAKGTVEAAGKALGAAAAAAFTIGALESVQREALGDKLAAQLALPEAESARAGDIAGSLYANAYGESLEEVNNALGGIHQNIGELGSFSNDEIEGMAAKALDLAAAFEVDVNRATRGAGQLIRNGLAADATEAFDLIVTGMQNVDANMRDELIDVIEEYSTDFKQLGLTGPQAMGMITSAVQAGARNTDIAADSIREFSIRAIDGTEASSGAFEALGFDADEMAQKIAGGGPAATEAMSEVLQALGGVEDKVAQEAIGIGLFGTKFEEMGLDATLALDPVASSLDDTAGAADRFGDTLNDNRQTKITEYKRAIEDWLVSLAETDGVVGDASSAVAAFGQVMAPLGPAIVGLGIVFQSQLSAMGRVLGRLVVITAVAVAKIVARLAVMAASAVATAARWVASMTLAAARGVLAFTVAAAKTTVAALRMAATMALTAARVVAGWVLMGVQSMIHAARMAAAWFIAMGPIGWIIGAVIGLVALIIANWDTVKRWTVAAFSAIGQFFMDWWPWLLALATGGLSLIVKWVIDHWDQIKAFTAAIWNAILNFIKEWWPVLVGAIFGPLGIIVGLVVKHWDQVKALFRAGVNKVLGIVAWFAELPGKVGAWFSSVKDAAVGKLESLIAWVKGVPDKILSALGDLANLLLQPGKNMVNSLLEGIKSAWGAVEDFLDGAIEGVTNMWPFSPAKEGPLRRRPPQEGGANIIRQLQAGMESQVGQLHASVGGTMRMVSTTLAPDSFDTSGDDGAEFTAVGIIDLGEGIEQAVQFKLKRQNRDLRRRVGAGSGANR